VKRRLSFISNSSSSSFVVLGINVGRLTKAKKEELMKEEGWEWDPEEYDNINDAFEDFTVCSDKYVFLDSYELKKNEYVVGDKISELSSEDPEEENPPKTMKELLEIQNKLQKKFKTTAEAKIYSFTKYN
jgi:hypothetical protein